jgi:cytochrome P450
VAPLMMFGTGSHICPGRYWAINEIKLLVALVLTKLDIQLMMDEDYQQKTRTGARRDALLSKLFVSLGPHEKDKHQFQIKYSVKQ